MSAGVAELLSRLGQQCTDRLAGRLADLQLTLLQARVLHAVAAVPFRSQLALCEQLGVLQSRMVALVDTLEGRGLLERRRNAEDRRLNTLVLTSHGAQVAEQLDRVLAAHEAELTGHLTDLQRETLAQLLAGMSTPPT